MKADITFRIFDHPALWIFQAQLPADFLKNHSPQVELAANWANQIDLAGYNPDKTTVKVGEKIRLVLYWEALAKAAKDYTTGRSGSLNWLLIGLVVLNLPRTYGGRPSVVCR
ncbi:MAG: hypothetical protein BroJett011_70210 [Chloroflexota bacterium]|nr:MAG: hypothetical protein BroJett011_70210 [Chloroflexota bacterium]